MRGRLGLRMATGFTPARPRRPGSAASGSWQPPWGRPGRDAGPSGGAWSLWRCELPHLHTPPPQRQSPPSLPPPPRSLCRWGGRCRRKWMLWRQWRAGEHVPSWSAVALSSPLPDLSPTGAPSWQRSACWREQTDLLRRGGPASYLVPLTSPRRQTA